MKKTIILTGLALLASVSCSRDEFRESAHGNAIDFRAAVSTKAQETDTDNLEAFTATAIDYNGDTYFNELEFTKEEDIFVSDPVYYWPASGNLTFYAWSHKDALDEVSVTEESQTISFTTEASIDDQLDLVAVKAEGSNTAEGMSIEFGHILSQIQINVKNINEGYVYKVKGVKIANVAASGTYDFTGTAGAEDGEVIHWDVTGSDKATYMTTYDEALQVGNQAVSVMGTEGNAMLIPQQLTPWDESGPAFVPETDLNGSGTSALNKQTGSYLAVLINIQTNSGFQTYPEDTTDEEEYGWVATAIDTDWKPGKKYTYILDFSNGAGVDESTNETILGKDIKFEPYISVSGWSVPSSGQIDM